MEIKISNGLDNSSAVTALAALAQESRLAIYRALVQAGPDGMAAGRISELTAIPPSSLSFHLKELSHAALVRSRQDGRFVIYSADFDAMNALLGFLTENCCGSASCAPVSAVSCCSPAKEPI
ncbi:MAG TPA: metalloregulator ArsR/SmtB family transcription factor [Rhodocyclaceae bacterium]|nr:metalloregulator ArsR/SmtB family transcription factor [Rhodocyclaceae bacterium]